jgi:hypothetical protein
MDAKHAPLTPEGYNSARMDDFTLVDSGKVAQLLWVSRRHAQNVPQRYTLHQKRIYGNRRRHFHHTASGHPWSARPNSPSAGWLE